MAEPHEREFMSLEDVRPSFPSDEDTGPSPFDTLWTEFARSHPRLSPPRTPTHRAACPIPGAVSSLPRPHATIDLRVLEYASEYDSNLMCPICHVPFIEPVVLDCDHTFCKECFEEYRNGGPSADRSRCPACRSYHLGGSRKASRLIKNMCNDIQVRCPNSDCHIVAARGYIEQHVLRDCPEQEMPCPDETCSRKTKRKHFVPEQCIHSSRVECDCGASIRLGRGEWIKHKDSECPNTNPTSPRSLEATAYADSEQQRPPKCPGAEFGCTDEIAPEDIETHTSSCPLARLAPALKKQSQLLQSLSDQLKMANLRNDVLETGFDRLSDLISTTIEPRLNRLSTAIETDPDTTTDTDIEEIPRNDLDFNLNLDVHQDFSSQNQTQTYHPTPSSHALTTRLTALESQTSTLQSHLTDLDARSSMSLMNETLRIREELAQINGAMYSTRAQVQWLLNRERMLGQRETTSMMGRGRQGQGQRQTGGSGSSGGNGSGGSATTPTPTSTAGASSGSSAAPGTQRPSMDRNMSSAWSTVSQAAAAGSTSGPSSAATSPMFSAARPSLRRLSGGSSQERVKL